jgi:Lipid A 3-O-deacylase (PagL)
LSGTRVIRNAQTTSSNRLVDCRHMNTLYWIREAGLTFRHFAVMLFFLSLAHQSEAQDYLFGVRAGGSFEKDAGDFQQAEAFGGLYLPWLWGSKTGFNLKPRVEGSAGCLDDRGEAGFVGTLGPVFELRKGGFPLSLEAGVSLTGLSRYDYEDRDLGGRFQFTDHAGLNWHITKKFTLGWRFQHMSNAHIYHCNPGLNQQMLSVSYSF